MPPSKTSTRSRALTMLLLFSGMALFGSGTPLSKLVVESFPVFTASLFRVGIGALVLLPFLAHRLGDIRRLNGRDWLVVGAIAAVGMVGFTVFLLYGMKLVSGVMGAIVMSTTPAVTAAASVLFLGESWSRRKVVSVVLAVSGIVLVNLLGAGGFDSGSDGSVAGERDAFAASRAAVLVGSLLVFAAVCSEAAYTLFGKLATRRLDPMLTVFLACVVSIPFFVVVAIALEWGELDPSSISTGGWVTVVFWGAATLGLGSVLWYAGLRRAEGTVAAGFMGVMPVSALVFSYVLLGEPVRTPHLIGFAMVFAGVVLISREHAGGDHASGGRTAR